VSAEGRSSAIEALCDGWAEKIRQAYDVEWNFGIPSRFAPRAREVDAVDGLASKALRTQLPRLIERPEFDASDRNRRFLQRVVDETLAGGVERIKVFGSDERRRC
jgi:hypothetical protein